MFFAIIFICAFISSLRSNDLSQKCRGYNKLVLLWALMDCVGLGKFKLAGLG